MLLWQRIVWTLRNISLSFITPTCLEKTPLGIFGVVFKFSSPGLLHVLSPDYIMNVLSGFIRDMCVGMRLDTIKAKTSLL